MDSLSRQLYSLYYLPRPSKPYNMNLYLCIQCFYCPFRRLHLLYDDGEKSHIEMQDSIQMQLYFPLTQCPVYEFTL